ncbi:MAG: Stp1/IreP family PP2C-type Ser/Thr phosphatase [Phycisphaerae bacterium]|nr:Stp1/IreP family PP2C-type Ser/Thr phosphatase [Phycisphaerae bacterium]
MTDQQPDIQNNPQVYTGLPFTWGALTDVGLCREQNEDAFLIEPEAGLFLVSDGMGGHPGGEVASDFVAENLSVRIETGLHKMRFKSPRAVRRLLKKAVSFHSRELYHEGQSESAPAGMGATVVLCLLLDGRCCVVNVGDSRLYRLRKNRFTQISHDHSYVNELIQRGKLDPDHAADHPDSAVITQYVGMEKKTRPHIRSFKLHPGDRLLLCTDGLTDMLGNAAIKSILLEIGDPQQVVQTLIDKANHAGGHDNITALLIDWLAKTGK